MYRSDSKAKESGPRSLTGNDHVLSAKTTERRKQGSQGTMIDCDH